MKRVLTVLFLLSAAAAPAADLPAACTDALRRALGSSAAWRMERRLPGSVRTLVSTGVVTCTVGEGIVWKTLHPFFSSVSMTTNAMVFADEDGERVKPLDDLPQYGEIRRRTDAFARGDTGAFDGLFALEGKSAPSGGWTLVFTPEVRAMRRLFSSIVLSGDATVTSAVLTTEDGGASTIRFKELPRVR